MSLSSVDAAAATSCTLHGHSSSNGISGNTT
jgi:hypothetical protein